MKKSLFVALSLAFVAGFVAVFGAGSSPAVEKDMASIAFPSGTWRYKTTVVIETPEGDKTGSAVREVNVRLVPGLTSSGVTSDIKVKGEAVVVDLGKRGTVFALMRGANGSLDYRYNVVFNTFPFKEGLTAAGVRYYDKMDSSERAVLGVNDYPQFVRFRNLADSKTIEKLVKFKICDGHQGWPDKYCIASDRFEEAFGRGVKLKEVNIEMTGEPVNPSIEGWVSSFARLPLSFSRNDFISQE